MRDRPTDQLSVVITEALDNAWAPVIERARGMADDEYWWEPVVDAWTIRNVGGTWRADWSDPDPEPAPVTTIAWRCWHIAVDCLDSYSRRLFAATGSGCTGAEWVGDRSTAIELLDASWSVFRAGVGAWSEPDLLVPLGDAWGPFANYSNADLALHAAREVIHHGAEIALLRDLYRTRR